MCVGWFENTLLPVALTFGPLQAGSHKNAYANNRPPRSLRAPAVALAAASLTRLGARGVRLHGVFHLRVLSAARHGRGRLRVRRAGRAVGLPPAGVPAFCVDRPRSAGGGVDAPAWLA